MSTDHPDWRLGRTHDASTPWFEPPLRPPVGSPNVVYIVLDDTGFADLGCYGSEIRTPNIDRLASRGLRFTNFHTTTLCSPSRACLLTGRNHHAVGMRMLANVDSGWPSGRGRVSLRAGTVAEMLRPLGFSTLAVGKWHLTPTNQINAAGPYDQWPLGRGFERYYGFMDGATDQFYPELVHDNHWVEPPSRPEDGYHLSEDLVERAIGMVSEQISHGVDKPFLLYLAFGATHAPHHAPRAYIDGYRGAYDGGWNRIRQERFTRQIELGIVPEDTSLPPFNPGIPDWEHLSEGQRRVCVRLQEAYAGFLEHTDAQIGRLVAFLERVGELDNTLIFLLSDNGAAMEGGPYGAVTRARFFNGVPEDDAFNLAHLDDIGGPKADNHYPWGWAQASNTPLRWYKYHTHGGGIRDPLIVHWPARITDGGGLRRQFHHVIDLTPTVLDVLGVPAPEQINGVPQMPIHGISLAYTFTDPDAPGRKQHQYFEMFGNRAIWADGWKAVTKHEPGTDYGLDRWELYHLDQDFSESRDLADAHPEKLKELIELWWLEAGRYDVLPLDDRSVELFRSPPKPGSVADRSVFTYYPQTSHVHPKAAPPTQDVSHTITAHVVRADESVDGVLVSYGNTGSGYVLFVKDNRLHYEYNYCGSRYVLTSETELPVGSSALTMAFTRTGRFQGRAELLVDGTSVAEAFFPKTLSFISLAGLDVGRDALSPVSDSYRGEFPFRGAIDRIVYTLARDSDQPAAELLDD